MTDFYAELSLDRNKKIDELNADLSRLESTWKRREITNPEKATTMLALIIQARKVFASDTSRRAYDKDLDNSHRQPEKADPNRERNEALKKWKEQSESYYESGQYDLAKIAIEKAISLANINGDDDVLFALASDIYRDNGELDTAMSYINRAIVAAPDVSAYYLSKGLIYDHYASAAMEHAGSGNPVNFRIEARKIFQLAASKAQQSGDLANMARACGALAFSYYFQEPVDKKEGEEFANLSTTLGGDTWGNADIVLKDIETIRAEERRNEITRERLLTVRNRIKPAGKLIAVSGWHTVGVQLDGTVVAVGNNEDGQCAVSSWRNIVAVATSSKRTVGLRLDGTVVAVGNNWYGQYAVASWSNIVAVATSNCHTVGLRSDGTVVALGENENGQCNVSGWRDIVAITANESRTIGLRSDGTVVATGKNEDGQCNVSGWTDIVAIDAGYGHTVGLRADGTVVAAGSNFSGQCNVSGWTDIVAVSAGVHHTVGLRSDGTIVSEGKNPTAHRNASGWTDIVAVATSNCHTVGLRSDGKVVAVGDNAKCQCYVHHWKLFNSIDNLEQEQRKAIEALSQTEETRRQSLLAEKSRLREELDSLHGLFTGKRRKEIWARLEEIQRVMW